MVGFALAEAGIPLAHDFRFVYQGDTPPEVNRSKFSLHLNDRGTPWNPEAHVHDARRARARSREVAELDWHLQERSLDVYRHAPSRPQVQNVRRIRMKITKLSDLKLDAKNANLGTDRGRKMLKQSLAELGAGRSILADKHGNVIAGNKNSGNSARTQTPESSRRANHWRRADCRAAHGPRH